LNEASEQRPSGGCAEMATAEADPSRALLGEASLKQYLLWVWEPSALPRVEEATTYASCFAPAATTAPAFGSALLVVDEARSALIGALKREHRDGGNAALNADSAQHVAAVRHQRVVVSHTSRETTSYENLEVCGPIRSSMMMIIII